MGCGIAHFGQKGLKPHKLENVGLKICPQGPQGAAHTGPRGVAHGPRGAALLLEIPLRRPSRFLGTNFETKIFKLRWF